MTDMRRTILWVVFSVSLFLLWDAWNKHNGGTSMFAPKPAVVAAAGAAPALTGSNTTAPGAAQTTAGLPTVAAPVASEQVTVSTDVIRATLDSKGGDLVRLELLKHSELGDATKHVVLFDHTDKRIYLAQTGAYSANGGPALPNHLTVMTLLPGERNLKDGDKSLTLSFESPEVGGVKLSKTYTFTRGQYTVGVSHVLKNVSGAAISPKLYLQLARDGHVEGNTSFLSAPTAFTGPAMYTESGKFKKVEFADIDKAVKNKSAVEHEKTADNGWVAMVQHYFASTWIVADKAPREFSFERIEGDPGNFNQPLYRTAMVFPLGELAPGTERKLDAVLFAGPQEGKTLESLAPGLDLVKDYGWLTILAKPLYWLLDQLHSLLGNWGWAIVVLVVLLKIAFYGLNAHAYKSMAKMKAVNPKVMDMRERYKDKPQQMQQEMMRIYREEKVNPLGGCLPIFVQMPFFIALYWVLLSTVEMRNAPWIGWIHDLSTKDPFFILPLLMTASTMFQTWLNPTPPDPVQAKMMWIMPLVFSVMFFVFPAGLVLYWLTNNVLGIAQQWYINKKLGVK